MHRIVDEAVALEREFCCDALSVALVGMNAALMAQYIEYVADRLLAALGCAKLYSVANPFDWMVRHNTCRRDCPSCIMLIMFTKINNIFC